MSMPESGVKLALTAGKEYLETVLSVEGSWGISGCSGQPVTLSRAPIRRRGTGTTFKDASKVLPLTNVGYREQFTGELTLAERR